LLAQAYAQNRSIEGIIVEEGSSSTLAGAHVFLSQTTIGTYSDALGYFKLDNIPPGKQTLVVSMIGFKEFNYDLDRLLELGEFVQLELQVDEQQMEEIVVEEKRPKEWLQNLEVFKEQFVGITRNSGSTEILNPQVLDFENEGNILRATVREPLIIDNHALGYRITFYLRNFAYLKDGLSESVATNGYSVYEEMQAFNDEEAIKWEAERQRAYKGSFTHFIHALIRDELEEEGFGLFYADEFRIPAGGASTGRRVENPRGSIYNFTSSLTEISLFSSRSRYLRVVYDRETTESSVLESYKLSGSRSIAAGSGEQCSWVSFPNDRAIINIKNGKESGEYRAMLHGYWGYTHRIADLLPNNYRPNL
jgi:hypothetical protein